MIEKVPRELNTKAYTMTLKKEEALNQWLNEQLKAGLIVESNHDMQHLVSISQRKTVHYDWSKTTGNSTRLQ